MMDDLISRQAAIDVLDVGAELLRRVLDDACIVGAERKKCKWTLDLIEAYISDIKELPSAQPEQPKNGGDIWDRLSEVYNMSNVPDEAKSIIGDVMIEVTEQPDIIACGDCKHWICHDRRCEFWNHDVKPLDWCSYAEWKEGVDG